MSTLAVELEPRTVAAYASIVSPESVPMVVEAMEDLYCKFPEEFTGLYLMMSRNVNKARQSGRLQNVGGQLDDAAGDFMLLHHVPLLLRARRVALELGDTETADFINEKLGPKYANQPIPEPWEMQFDGLEAEFQDERTKKILNAVQGVTAHIVADLYQVFKPTPEYEADYFEIDNIIRETAHEWVDMYFPMHNKKRQASVVDKIVDVIARERLHAWNGAIEKQEIEAKYAHDPERMAFELEKLRLNRERRAARYSGFVRKAGPIAVKAVYGGDEVEHQIKTNYQESQAEHPLRPKLFNAGAAVAKVVSTRNDHKMYQKLVEEIV